MINFGDKVIAADGFRGEVITTRHGGKTGLISCTSASEVNLAVLAVMAESGEIRVYRLDTLDVDEN